MLQQWDEAKNVRIQLQRIGFESLFGSIRFYAGFISRSAFQLQIAFVIWCGLIRTR